MDHLKVQTMELHIYLLMDRIIDKTINRMGTGINNSLTLLIMSLYHLTIRVLCISMLSCSPSWVKWEDVIIPLAKAMVCIEINLTRTSPNRERSIEQLNLGSLSLRP